MGRKNTNSIVSWESRYVYLGIECRTLQGHKKYPIWRITYLCQNIHRKYSLVIYLQIFLTAEAWWVALLRDNFEVFLKKYICKMNDWQIFISTLKDLFFVGLKTYPISTVLPSSVHVTWWRETLVWNTKWTQTLIRSSFQQNWAYLGDIGEGSSACARCHGRLGLSEDQNHIGTGMWWEELKPIWATNRS